MLAPPRRFREDAPPLPLTLAAMAALVADGAGGDVAARWTVDAARSVGRSPDPLELARALVQRVRGRVAFVPDEYGREVVQDVADTLEGRAGGDCDDVAVAVAALLRKAGYRTAFGIYRRADGEPAHVVAVLEHPTRAGEWVPAEASEPVPFGEWAPVLKGGSVELYALDGAAGAGLGFLPELIGAAGGVLGSIFGAKGASSAAKEQRKGNEALATAQRVAALESAAVEKERLKSNERIVAQFVNVTRDALPYLVVAVGLGSLGSILGKPRRRAA